jgi:hypothetical protein
VVQEYIAGVLICITTRSWLVSFASNLKLKNNKTKQTDNANTYNASAQSF